MIKKINHLENNIKFTSGFQPVIIDSVERKSERSITYVVVRDGLRTSDREYLLINDPIAIAECNFWKRVSTNHSYGEPVDIVQYDSKKHRVW